MNENEIPLLHFTKMQSAGNDYIYFDLFRESNSRIIDVQSKSLKFGENVVSLADAAVKLSHRRYGIGGDGIILINSPPYTGLQKKVHGEMIMYNSDGSLAEMCGNGLSCVALFLHTHIYANNNKLEINYSNELNILTGAGMKNATIIEQHNSFLVRLSMGAPRITPNILGKQVILEYKTKPVTVQLHYVNIGNPHVIVFIQDVLFDDEIYQDSLENFPVEVLGPQLETHELFPDRINVEFVKILDIERAMIQQRTWERGSGETMACGTGASAVAFMSDKMGRIHGKDKTITVRLRGGDLLFKLHMNTDTGDCSQIFMFAQPKEVYQGCIDCNKLKSHI
jgi:diaminopimelate epimerase